MLLFLSAVRNFSSFFYHLKNIFQYAFVHFCPANFCLIQQKLKNQDEHECMIMNHLRAAESMKNDLELPNLVIFGNFPLLLLDYGLLSSSFLNVKQNMYV